MVNAKPIVDNNEKAKSKKKKDPLEIILADLTKLKVGDSELSGDDIAAHADALAAAKVAMEAIKSAIEDAEVVLKSAMMQQYCQHFAKKGRAPSLRKSIGNMGSCQVVQQNTAKLTKAKAEELARKGIDIHALKSRTSYTVRMGEASAEATKEIVASLKDILGDDYNAVVSEHVHVDKTFFGKFDKIIRESLSDDEALDDKMLSVLRILSPVIQLGQFKSDLSEENGYKLAYQFAKVSAEKKKEAEEAQRIAKQKQAELSMETA